MPLTGKIVVKDGIIYNILNGRAGVVGFEDNYHFPKPVEFEESIDGCDVEYIGEGAFANCPLNLEEVVLPSKCLSIKARAFQNCKYLTSVAYLNSFTYSDKVFVGEKAFEGCSELLIFAAHDVHLWLMDSSFCECKKLDTILASLFVTKGVVFNGCSSLNLIFVADGAFLSAKTFGNANLHKIIFSGLLKRPSKSMFNNLKDTIIVCQRNFVFSDLVFEGYNMTFLGEIS